MTTEPSITGLLGQVRAGDRAALERLWPAVYDELRALAGRLLHGERPGHTLRPTALVLAQGLRLSLWDGQLPRPGFPRRNIRDSGPSTFGSGSRRTGRYREIAVFWQGKWS